ncbi:hypothetical protein LCGC14_0275360 [marine sediment metagenome]|uniref:Sulfotransferase domain-containing protein n=1 Tax=marine sediment metagenome TaxID=412755 RepID=A0A0F9WIE4_9ZZZZ
MSAPIWVFVTGTYRTGSTTQNRIAAAIVEHANRGRGIGYHKESRLVEHDKDEDELVICKVFRYLPDESETAARFLKEGRIRVVGTVRDPRDIFVSMQERARRSGKIGEFSGKTVINEKLPMWLGWFDMWVDKIPRNMIHVSKFEVMIEDLSAEALRIATFLGIAISLKEARTLTNPFRLPDQQKAKDEYWKKRRKLEKAGENPPREHPVLPSLPAVVFGTSGHWKTWLNHTQVRMIERSCKKYMARWGYK